MKLIIGNKNYSSWSLRGWLAAKQSGLSFEALTVHIDGDDWQAAKHEGHFQPSAGKVPVLWDGDVVVWDNQATIHKRDAFDSSSRRVLYAAQVEGGLRRGDGRWLARSDGRGGLAPLPHDDGRRRHARSRTRYDDVALDRLQGLLDRRDDLGLPFGARYSSPRTTRRTMPDAPTPTHPWPCPRPSGSTSRSTSWPRAWAGATSSVATPASARSAVPPARAR